MKNFVSLESIKKMPLMKLPVRSIYIPLETGKILLSPGSCLTRAQLESLGQVTDIVAPNLFHCGGVSQAASVYSTAKIWGVQGTKTVKKEISWMAELTASAWPYQDELPMVEIAGMPKVNEKVFIHKKSKSLFIADLCFNLVDSKGIGSWLILNMFGTYNKFGVRKFFLKFVEDKKAFENSLQQLFSYDFENIYLSHGQNIIGDGKKRLQRAFTERGISFSS